MRFPLARCPALAGLLLSSAACPAGQSAPQPPPAVQSAAEAATALSGSWGGEGIALEITPEGANVEYDCAHGSIDGRIVPDRRGCFEATGAHVEEHGGPTREGAGSGEPARYSGCIDRNRMQLVVRRAADGSLLGRFTLVAGQEPALVKCR